MVSIKSTLMLLAQGLAVTATTPYPQSTTTTSSNPSPSPTGCPPLTLEMVKITSPDQIKAGEPFTITWESPKPDSSKNHTEARVELWARNGGPVNSPMSAFKSDRLFDTNSFTHTFPTSYVNATTKGGGIIWYMGVFVYSTYLDSKDIELESWNIPYYGLQTNVKFV